MEKCVPWLQYIFLPPISTYTQHYQTDKHLSYSPYASVALRPLKVLFRVDNSMIPSIWLDRENSSPNALASSGLLSSSSVARKANWAGSGWPLWAADAFTNFSWFFKQVMELTRSAWWFSILCLWYAQRSARCTCINRPLFGLLHWPPCPRPPEPMPLMVWEMKILNLARSRHILQRLPLQHPQSQWPCWST